ncbi:hypothetical protein DTO027B5_7666 [Paecilomyces variotii]|nr:hypothetical protein DTO027B3_5212 [Paecilomyces variotii]KAJ9330575.1 hypothetical protein DTO027B5_7666 [Paecilomyces variotii]KAJ9356894.1 hypothetical protein DTO027B9_3378 [Paecilomyces variotii]
MKGTNYPRTHIVKLSKKEQTPPLQEAPFAQYLLRPEAKGLLVMQMEWDGNTEKDDNVLKNVGKTAKVHQKRVEVKEALKKARETAESAEWRREQF